ncbi:MAG: hypothetical protein WCO11_00145 [Sphingomonadales bacterium]|jgi:hypothetical protein
MVTTMLMAAMAVPAAAPGRIEAASFAGPDRLTDAAMRLRLAREGFTDMQIFHKVGIHWRTTARRGNRRYAVQIAPDGMTMRMPID